MYSFDKKFWLGEFFTNSSGHPDGMGLSAARLKQKDRETFTAPGRT
jgi:hypothetical protein